MSLRSSVTSWESSSLSKKSTTWILGMGIQLTNGSISTRSQRTCTDWQGKPSQPNSIRTSTNKKQRSNTKCTFNRKRSSRNSVRCKMTRRHTTQRSMLFRRKTQNWLLYRTVTKYEHCSTKANMTRCTTSIAACTMSTKRFRSSWRNWRRRTGSRLRTIWRRPRTNLAASSRPLRKRGLCMRWRRSIWKRNWSDIKSDLGIWRISAGSWGPATLSWPRIMKMQ